MASSPSASAAGSARVEGYQVVARRYRPQRFADLVGQEHVARGLVGAIESGRIGHAYLFAGARGVGKTSAARIYAKALECPSRAAGEPCNACDSCAAIGAGQDVDVVEIDAASNRGIEEMRQLRQNVAVRPARGRFKTYIIDEVHMLTREAFNALLKTLEEPPGHVKFVLCTTEPEKLPITILSRCQRFDFQTVDAASIALRLEQIVRDEGAQVTPEALSLIARRAAGSMRDSQSLLEQLLGAATGPLGVDDVHAVIGSGREEQIGALVACLADRDARGAIAAFDKALAGGADPGGILEQVLAALRDSLVASVGCGPEALLQPKTMGIDLAEIGRGLGTVTTLAMLQIIDHTLSRMRSSSHAVILAEMAIVRLAGLEDLDNLADAVARVASGASVAGTPTERPLTRPGPAPGGRAESEKKKAEPGATGADREGEGPSVIAEGGDPTAAAVAADRAADPLQVWHQAADTVGGLAVDFAQLAVRASWDGDRLRVVLPASAGNAGAFLRRSEVAAGMTRAASTVAGRPVRIAIDVENTASESTAGDRISRPAPTERATAAVSQAVLLREVAEHPLVMRARTLFDAAVRRVEAARPRAASPLSEPDAANGATGVGADREQVPNDEEPAADFSGATDA